MKKNYLIALAFIFLAACETTQKRIEKNLDYFMTLPKDAQQKIQAGEIGLGFTPKMVYLAWGKAADQTHMVDTHGNYETWIYTRTETETHYRTVPFYDDTDKKWKTKEESYYIHHTYASKFVAFQNDQVVRFGTYPRGTVYTGPGDYLNPFHY